MLGDTLLDEWVEFGAQLVDTLPISLAETGGDRTKAAAEEAEAAEDLTRALGHALAPLTLS